MKRLTIALLLVLVAGTLFAQVEIARGRIHTIAWDPVTVPSGSVEYEILLEDSQGGVELVDLVDVPEATITIPDGRYRVGVLTSRIVDGEEVARSSVNWSDVNGAATPVPFLLEWFEVDAVGGLRLR